MGYAIVGLYVVLAAVLSQLFALTSRVAKLEERFVRIEDKIDNLTIDVKKIAGIVDIRSLI
ncbi:MAG: hypothetical protein CO162_01775 [bacterium (Candidatus Ratteibacteria) CG_4_9_14_3_um_filter_41_21]|uniref:Uncharacterized protein n=1 Tax=bacterium (Candidatus Ratteibacteria) CG_4_9_14_3_um_filter_41_21 TaxID=2014289 RepID=A0A2M7YH73_9BACT|nr:MAG: hypothetical protein CO162_01775 [bacterium (Candidatus Ratteibacteria) CG_4_9_14_3_um_filter_41_21]